MSTTTKNLIWQVVVIVLASGLTAFGSTALALWSQTSVTAVVIEQIKTQQKATDDRIAVIEHKASDDRDATAQAIAQVRSDLRDVGTNVGWIRAEMERGRNKP